MRIQVLAHDSALFKMENLINYPNPFNPKNTVSYIRFNLSKDASGKINIYSISGVHVKEIELIQVYAGENIIEWDGCNMSGDMLSNGAYFYSVQLENSSGVSIR